MSVVALGAVCELARNPSTVSGRTLNDHDLAAGLSFHLDEFAEISDAGGVISRSDRGWSSGRMRFAYGLPEPDELGPGPLPIPPIDITDPWQFETRQTLTKSVLAVVDPDDDEEWYEWVRARLGELDVEVDSAPIRAAPYRVEFGPLLDQQEYASDPAEPSELAAQEAETGTDRCHSI